MRHEAGDLILKKLATICVKGARTTDIVARAWR
jgi:GGDEF domain-containing protein